MSDTSKLLWNLFSATGLPQYYSLYSALRDASDALHSSNKEPDRT